MSSQQAYFKSPQDIPDDLQELCIEYFFMFSRFEYALKENGFLKKSRYKNAEPNWKKFVEEFGSTYVPSDEARNLLKNPPDRHIVRDDCCQWEKIDFDHFASDLDKVVFIIKTIRNNLFHGGENSHPDWDNPERNAFLIKNAISVLGNLAELSELERDYWRNYY
jgi:hypothetical protein